jgi:hypothetical protein
LPEDENDHYFYYYVKFTDEKGKVREHWAYRSITNNDYTVGQTVRVIFFPGHLRRSDDGVTEEKDRKNKTTQKTKRPSPEKRRPFSFAVSR